MRDLPPRHRSLRGAIDGSYDLLSREEQALFRALSVFVGGFTSEAVAAVCRPVCRSQNEALQLLSDLRDKSLVRLEREGDRRYVLSESLRQYGEERLEQDDAALLANLRERHAAFFLDLAEQQAALLQGAGQVAALNLLETEAANLRAAMTDQINQARWDEAARFGIALRRFWQLRGRLREGRDLAFPRCRPRERDRDAGLRARLLFAAGFSHLYGSEPARAVPFYEESLRLAEESDDLPVLGQALNGLGGVAHRRGEPDRAEDYYRRAETVERRQNNDRGVALTLNNQGLIAVLRGDYERARQLYAESLKIRERQGDQVSQAQLWNHLGAVAQVLERYEEAQAAFERSLALSDAVGDAEGKACTLTNKGHLALHQNALNEAERHYRAALDILRGGDDRANVAECLTSLGLVCARRGDFATAARLCGEGLVLHRDAGSREGVAAALEALAEIAQACEQPELCFVLLTAAGSLHAETGARRLPQDADRLARLDQAARAALAGSPLPPAAGTATDLPEVLRLALALVQELARTEDNPLATAPPPIPAAAPVA
jgi:tetratricopeptide (TPR) repeat protein